ncbi:hypothetical protein CEXT_397511 [Caerostris extrusa]|uniref:Uncharacterized protein n=1 Tax=Caerostris extrusa TaxID=172846 RepID=A0AAV4WKF0_CAEEX|nr:hypothetical protein CEXT_397511 [Caerostris extrusa]
MRCDGYVQEIDSRESYVNKVPSAYRLLALRQFLLPTRLFLLIGHEAEIQGKKIGKWRYFIDIYLRFQEFNSPTLVPNGAKAECFACH